MKSLIPSVVVTSQGPVSAELIDSWDLDVLAYSAGELSEVSGVHPCMCCIACERECECKCVLCVAVCS